MKFALASVLCVFATNAHAINLVCVDAKNNSSILYSAIVLGPNQLGDVTMYSGQDKQITRGPFLGQPNLKARNPIWRTYQIFADVSGDDCITGTCTTLVIPQNLGGLVGKSFPAYAVSKTDGAGGSQGLNCLIR